MPANRRTRAFERRPDVTELASGRWCDEHNRYECTGNRSHGRGTCHGPAIAGATVCRMHSGGPKARANAAIRAAVARWTDGQQTLDPGETLLRLMTVAYLRAEQHADELDNILTEHGWRDAFVGDAMGEFGKVGEYAKQLSVWEAQERKQAADLAVKAVAAGLEERRVRAEEQQVALFAQALDAALQELGLADRTAEVKSGVSRHLRSIAG